VEEMDVVKIRFPESNSGCVCSTFTFSSAGNDLKIGDLCVTTNPDDDSDLSIGQVIGRYKIPKQKSADSVQDILRKADEQDIKHFEEKGKKEEEAHQICWGKIKDRELPMKLVKTRYSFDSSKITFYFTSEKRVDFRDLVKDLAYIFKRRIELRQIGVRDEAKMMGGYGCCGQELCCASFLSKLGRIRIKMAREQNMTLTPSKISGICGKLLCCLEFENEWYHEVKGKMPKVGNTIKTRKVKGKVEDVDLFHGIIKIKDDDGNLVEIAIDEIKKGGAGRSGN